MCAPVTRAMLRCQTPFRSAVHDPLRVLSGTLAQSTLLVLRRCKSACGGDPRLEEAMEKSTGPVYTEVIG